MTAYLQRASVFGVVYEDTAGTLKPLSSGADLIPLKSGSFSMTSANEELANDELLNDIGRAKPFIGKENPTGSHGAYFKNSQTTALPEWAPFLVSAMGTGFTRAADTIANGGLTDTIIVSNGALYEVGQGLLIKDSTNGYSIRNIAGISGNNLTLNYAITAAATAVAISECGFIKPLSSAQPTFSAWHYIANEAGIQAMAGCRTTNVTINANAGQQAEINFDYAGTKYYFNPIYVTSANNKIDFNDGNGVKSATFTSKHYRSPDDFADELASKMDAASTGYTISASYSPTTGKYTLATSGSVLSLLWVSGANSTVDIGNTIGFTAAADQTGATSYTSNAGITLASGLTATYDNADSIIVKNAELFIGDATNNVCRQASTISLTVATPVTDVDSICAETGVSDKLILSREVTLTASILLEKWESNLFDRFLNNTSTPVMCNVGKKDGAGNWVPYYNMNFYLGNATITGHTVTGDDVVRLDLTIKGYVDSTRKDIYINGI